MRPVHSIAVRAGSAARAADFTLASAAAAWAEESAATPPAVDIGDTAWALTASALVLMMTPPRLARIRTGERSAAAV